MFSACVNKCYVLHVIYQLSSLDCILKTKTGESQRNHGAYMLWPGPGVVVVAVVSVTRRVLAQQWCLDAGWPPPSPSPAFADHASNTGELQLLWPAAAPQLPTVNTPHPNWGTAAHLLNGHYFSFLVSFLAERSCLGVSGPFYILQAEGSEFAPYLQVMCLALLLYFISMSWSQYKKYFCVC